MPQRRTASGGLRSHARTSSGGSSRVGLNLHFTQKDTGQSKLAKKNGHVHHETNSRAASPYPPKANGNGRVQSKEQIAAQKRAPVQNGKQHATGKKAGFSIASPGSDEDDENDDEWVSSESGAATPAQHDSDDDGTDLDGNTSVAPKKEKQQQRTPVQETSRPILPPLHTEPALSAATPRAESHALPHVPPISDAAGKRFTVPAMPLEDNMQSSSRHAAQVAGLAGQISRSEAPSPTHTHSRHSSHYHKRQSVTRPPSTHSVTRLDAPLRPHPLIRGQSYGQSMHPSPLAPLAITTDAAQAQISSSPTHSVVGMNLSSSPTSVKTMSASQASPSANQLRRTSISSTRSAATVPTPNPAHPYQPAKTHDRHRTISALSTSSSFSALSSLAQIPTTTRPSTPQMVAFFPPPLSNLETIHPLLPAPFTNSHLTLLAHRRPGKESFDRVIKARLNR